MVAVAVPSSVEKSVTGTPLLSVTTLPMRMRSSRPSWLASAIRSWWPSSSFCPAEFDNEPAPGQLPVAEVPRHDSR